MRMYAYLILAVLVTALLFQPLCEVVMVCKDRITFDSAVNNAVRAAKKESYNYVDMRDAVATTNQAKFMDEFARVLAVGLDDLSYSGGASYATTLRDSGGNFDDTRVRFYFSTENIGGRSAVKVHISAESEYKFKTRMMKDAQELILRTSGAYMLTHDRTYTLIIVN